MTPPTASVKRQVASHEADLVAFGARVRELRDLAGLTQDDLATASGMSRVTISRVEHGKLELGVTRAARLATALGVEPGALFG